MGPLPPGHSIRVVPVESGELWATGCLDENELPNPGSATLIGPDERIWILSSNPSIHDLDLGVRQLEAVYRSGCAAALDSGEFAERLAQMTQRRRDDEDAFLKDVRAGSLRARTTRHLP